MVFKKLGKENLAAIVNVRLTNDEKVRLKDDADTAALSMSELIRRRYFGRPILAQADTVMVKELRRLGGLLKQVHTTSNSAYSNETATLLSDISRFIEILSTKK